MSNPFFDHPILNSPYARPERHWELDGQGQPTQKIVETRRRAEFITPIPKPKKRKKASKQEVLVFDEGKGLSTKEQQYDPTSIINEVRGHVATWRALPKASQWQETPGGSYAECCHIRPLGKPHNGPDTLGNVLCLCPTHHVLVDYHAIHFSDDFAIDETGETLKVDPDHKLDVEHIQYHRGLMTK